MFFCLLCFSIGTLANDWRYTVRPGDTLWSICAEYTYNDSCWRELANYNSIDDPTTLSVGYVLNIPASWLKQASIAVTAAYVSGEVTYTVMGEQPAVLVADQKLALGTTVTVGEGAATLSFEDGSFLVMNAQSELVIDSVSAFKQTKVQSIEVSLPRGGIRVSVPKRHPRTQFKVTTPAAVAAVRGTIFRVKSDVDADVTRSEVLEGVVAIDTAAGSKDLLAGFGLKTGRGQPLLEPVELLAAPQWNLECSDPGYVEWEGAPDTMAYQLVLMEDDSNVDRVISVLTIADSHYTYKGLEEKCYQVRVNSVDAGGFNGFENERQLCNVIPLIPPFINKAKLGRGGLSASWKEVVAVSSYIIEVSADSEFSDILRTENISGVEMELTLKPERQSVYIRAKSVSNSGRYSDYSQPIYLERKSNTGKVVGVLAAILVFAIL